MNTALLHSEVQEFIRNYTKPIPNLAFKGSPFKGISVQELMQQIEGFRKTQKKLPSWHITQGFLYPPRLHIEQSSSEITARYKASLLSGKALADCTGGLGVDSYYFSRQFESVTYFEQNADLAELVAHNFKVFGIENIQCIAADALPLLKDRTFDVVYVDPARRHDSKGKVFFLKDCEPNLVAHGEYLLGQCETLLVKTSPMLDISVGLSELKNVTEIHIVAVNNEVKEVLWLLRKKSTAEVVIKTIHFKKDKTESFNFTLGTEGFPSYCLPQKYLYEPNAAIMKSGAFQQLPESFGISKLQMHSHLYTSENFIDFPGRVFRIEQILPYRKAEVRKFLSKSKAHVTVRNFPETVQGLRTKWRIEEGGDTYMFFTTTLDDRKVVLICSKIFT